MTKKKNNWYSNHKKPVLICGIVVLVLLIVYLAGMLYYNDKFLNGTMVNGSDVGGMTLQKANDQLSKKVNGQSLKLIFNDGQNEVLQSAQLGVSYNKDNSLNQLMKNQNKWAWFIGFFKNEKNTLTDLIQISDENLTNGIASMEHAKEENQIAPTDAYIQYKDGSVVLESDFVSGKESDPTRLTPSGTYYIYNKERNRVLRGTKQPNGKYEYESPVSYWMPFNKGIGLHDASWRSTFGRDIYINSGSHGCINLPTGFAGSLYSQIYVNLPVVVYR